MGATKSKRILLILPTLPYPIRANGISVRYLPIIEHLSKDNELHLLVIDERGACPDTLKRHCASVSFIPKPQKGRFAPLKKLGIAIRYLSPWSTPISYKHYSASETIDRILNAAGSVSYDCLLFVSPLYADFLPLITKVLRPKKVVIDFIDSPYLHALRRSKSTFRFQLFERYECWKTRRWEASLVLLANCCVYVSPADANAVALKTANENKVCVIPNGVYIDDYTPARSDAVRSPSIAFLGNMQYLPNVDAAHWLYDNVFRLLQTRLPRISYYIIGREPVDSIVALSNKPGVIVTGTVESIWPYVNAADIFVFPLRKGAGIQNKMLEVMYAARPVIASPISNDAIGAVSGRDLLVCQHTQEYVNEILNLLELTEERYRLGQSARTFVATRFSWGRILTDFGAVLTAD